MVQGLSWGLVGWCCVVLVKKEMLDGEGQQVNGNDDDDDDDVSLSSTTSLPLTLSLAAVIGFCLHLPSTTSHTNTNHTVQQCVKQ
jgi:hypothetical protein